MSEKVYTPLPPPATVTEDPRANISEKEQEQYDAVLAHFSAAEYKIPETEPQTELTEAEKFWLSRECLLR